LSHAYRLLSCPFGLVVVMVRSDLFIDAELLVLRHETRCSAVSCAVGRGGITPTGSGLRGLSRLVNRRRWADILPGTQATILRWHRHLVARKWTHTDRCSPRLPADMKSRANR
jgi:hypothetical protein